METKEKKEEPQEEKLSIVDEAKKVRDDIKAENDRREKILEEDKKLQAEKMLSGTSGGREEEIKVEETNHEYRERVEKEMQEGKYD